MTDFQEFQSIPRLSREMVITEKIDGTNAQILIEEDGSIQAGSRTRWITRGDDNFGFADWVINNAEALQALGPGRHYGEWWGRGIQRNYGLEERRFSLFNTGRWHSPWNTGGQIAGPGADPTRCEECPVCHVVPILYKGWFETQLVDFWLDRLAERGSFAAFNFMKPEGVVVYHKAGNLLFKKTLDKNDGHKGGHRR